jgi:hypothetical protein
MKGRGGLTSVGKVLQLFLKRGKLTNRALSHLQCLVVVHSDQFGVALKEICRSLQLLDALLVQAGTR